MEEGLIRNTPDLKEACDALVAGGVAALDTEFVWRASFRPHLAIVQMAGADGVCRALDCQLGTDPAPFAGVLSNPSVVKILHAAHQDLELLYHYTAASPVNVFDTQLAAGFCGHPANLGLQKLLYEVLDVGLPKTETCTDWSQRPLTDAQVRYALDDVRYLVALRAALLAQCDTYGTRAWLEEDLLKYEDPAAYGEMDPDEAWKRVKGASRHLRPQGLAGLRALASVRERRAREWNLPRAWLGEDGSLVDLAMRTPSATIWRRTTRRRWRRPSASPRKSGRFPFSRTIPPRCGMRRTRRTTTSSRVVRSCTSTRRCSRTGRSCWRLWTTPRCRTTRSPRGGASRPWAVRSSSVSTCRDGAQNFSIYPLAESLRF